MSEVNPYQPTQELNPENFGIRKVRVRPIQLLSRGYDFIRGQYMLFLGITVVGVLLGSAIPFGLLMGPLLVGIYLCFLQREQGQPVEFATLFRGFDYFKEAFIAFLILIAVSMLVMIPFMIAFFLILFLPIMTATANAGGGPPPPPDFPVSILILYPVMLLANIVIMLPFLFTFQLIADRNLTGLAAVKMSVRGVVRNFWGVLWAMFVIWVITMIAMMMCYVPAFLFMPISISAFFVLYRDIFGDGRQQNAA